MAFTTEQMEQVTQLMDVYINNNRPPEHMRGQVDLAWRVEQQNIFVYELLSSPGNADQQLASDVAKAMWVQKSKEWQIYWLRSNGKWERYQPMESVVNLQRFIIELEKDPHHCFWG